jgi:uracil-DNA glycosylase family 4
MTINSTLELRQEFERRAQMAELTLECPMSGSYLSSVCVIAEAPGSTEVAQQIPLSGASGRLFWNAVRDYAQLTRNDCYVTNVCKRQVAFDVDAMRKPVGKHELTGWQELLRWEISQLPALDYIIVLGGMALEAVVGKQGITQWRGSVLKTQIGLREVTVICCNNPALIMRDPQQQIIFNMDMAKIKKVRDGNWREHNILVHINPTVRQALDYVRLMGEAGKPVASDIEIIGGETACVGFANDANEAMCISFRTVDENIYGVEDELTIRRAIQGLYARPGVRHIMQNGHFDCTWLGFKDRIIVQPLYFDTMLAHHTLYPTIPHNLGFLTTQYTDHPYYKNEKDDWRDTGSIDNFWIYNGKDCALTWDIQRHLLNELRDQKLDKFFFEHVMRLQPHLIRMTLGGLKIDTVLKQNLASTLEVVLEQKLQKFHEAVQAATSDSEYRPNPKSPKQMSELYFSKLKLVGRGTSTDAINRELMFKHPRTSEAARNVIQAHNDYIEDQKFYSTYATSDYDHDGRMRCEYKQIGVQNAPGRLSSGQTMWGSGMNLQNQPDRAKAMFVADPGYCFVYIDGSQAEARVVGWKARIDAWIAQFERARLEGGYDAHNALAADMFGIPYDNVPTFDRYDAEHPVREGDLIFPNGVTVRFIAKRCRHGLNYRMAADKLSLTTGLPINVAMDAYNRYHRTTPEVRKWWHETELEVKKNKALYNAFGRRYLQLVPPTPESMDSIVAFYPQSTIGDLLNKVIYKSHDDPKWPKHSRIVLNIHDALIALARVGDEAIQTLRVMIKHAETALMIEGRELIIPADAAISQPDADGVHRWSTIRKIKRKDYGL